MEEARDDDVAMIKTLMNESAGKFRKAWRVTNLKTQKRFDNFVTDNNIRDTKLLFHGSRSENFWSIIKTGLVLMGATVMFSNIQKFGIYGLGIAWLVTPTVIIFMWLLGTKVLKMKNKQKITR